MAASRRTIASVRRWLDMVVVVGGAWAVVNVTVITGFTRLSSVTLQFTSAPHFVCLVGALLDKIIKN